MSQISFCYFVSSSSSGHDLSRNPGDNYPISGELHLCAAYSPVNSVSFGKLQSVGPKILFSTILPQFLGNLISFPVSSMDPFPWNDADRE